MKKIFAVAAVSMFMGLSINAQSVNDNNTTVADVVAELNQTEALQFIPMYQQLLADIENVCRNENMDQDKKTAKIESIKEDYSDMFSTILVTAQNEVAINSIPMEYINARITK